MRVVAPISVKLGEVDLDRARRRPLADDEVELVVLHGGIEDLLHRRVEAVDLVDEEDVAVLQVGEQRGEVAGLGDDRAGGGAEADAQLARHDLGERGLAEARRPREQHVVERVAARLGRLDEHLEVGARLLLADELAQQLRPQRRLRVVGLALGPRDEAGRRRSWFVLWAYSRRASRNTPSVSTVRDTADAERPRTLFPLPADVYGEGLSPRGQKSLGRLLHLLGPFAERRGAVHLGAVGEGALAGGDVLALAAPGLQRGRLQGAAVGERQLPRQRAQLRS